MLKLCLFAGKAGYLAPQTPRRLEVKAGILALLSFCSLHLAHANSPQTQGSVLSGVQLQGAQGPELSL